MGIGIVSLQTSQKREQAGPPFVSNSADNGLSVDAVTGHIVLGNDVGDPLAPAALLSNREILTDNTLALFSLTLNSPTSGVTTLLDGTQVQVSATNVIAPAAVGVTSVAGGTSTLGVTTGAGGVATLSVSSGAGGQTLVDIRCGPDIFQIVPSGGGTTRFNIGNGFPPGGVMEFANTVGQIQVGPTLTTSNTADFQITGTTTYRRFIQSTSAAVFNVDRDLDSGKLFRNGAAVNFALPNMAGANSRPGFVFRARVFNAAGITITAFAGTTINFGSLVTSVAGTLFSTDVGACITITFDVDGWVTESFVGAWGLT
jgi:hypothetical protein